MSLFPFPFQDPVGTHDVEFVLVSNYQFYVFRRKIMRSILRIHHIWNPVW